MEQLERDGSAEAAAWSTRFSRHYEQPGVAEAYAAGRFAGSWRMRLAGWREERIVTALARIAASHGPVAAAADLPCGAGRLTAALARGCGTRPVQFDRSPAMLALADGPARLVADAFALPLANGSIGLLLCNRLLHHLSEPAARIALLRELRRVAARAIVSFYDSASLSHLRRRRRAERPGARVSRRYAQSRAAFAAEAAASGWRVSALRAVLRGVSSQTYALLE